MNENYVQPPKPGGVDEGILRGLYRWHGGPEGLARKATILTTNLDYPEWYDLFKRKPLVDALLDRLRHHCITVRINGPSLRVPEQVPDQQAQDNASKPK